MFLSIEIVFFTQSLGHMLSGALFSLYVTYCMWYYLWTGIVGHPLGHCSNKEGKVIKRQTKNNSSWNNQIAKLNIVHNTDFTS